MPPSQPALADYFSLMSEVTIAPSDPDSKEPMIFVSLDKEDSTISISGPDGRVAFNLAQAIYIGAAIMDLYNANIEPSEAEIEQASTQSQLDFDDPLN